MPKPLNLRRDTTVDLHPRTAHPVVSSGTSSGRSNSAQQHQGNYVHRKWLKQQGEAARPNVFEQNPPTGPMPTRAVQTRAQQINANKTKSKARAPPSAIHSAPRAEALCNAPAEAQRAWYYGNQGAGSQASAFNPFTGPCPAHGRPGAHARGPPAGPSVPGPANLNLDLQMQVHHLSGIMVPLANFSLPGK